MPTEGSFVNIWLSPRHRKNMRLVEQLEERRKALLRMIPYAAAEELKKYIKKKLPGGRDYKDYLDSLEVSEVTGYRPDRQSAFTLHIRDKAKRVRRVESPRTALYVRKRKKLDRDDESIKLLEDMSPWTMDTIPFWPSESKAIVIQRRMSKESVSRIAERQKSREAEIRSRLASMGKKVDYGPKKLKRSRKKAIPDMAMKALSVEFGTGDEKPIPAWRPGLRMIQTTAMKRLPSKYKQINEAMYAPDATSWKRWPRTQNRIDRKTLEKYQGFQEKVSIK